MAMDLEKLGKTPTVAKTAKSDRADSYACSYTAPSKPASPGRGASAGHLHGTRDSAQGLPGKATR